MKTQFQKFTKTLLITCLIIGYSCSNDSNQPASEKEDLTSEEVELTSEEAELTPEEEALKDCEDKLNDPNFEGTVCCTLGSLTVSPGETSVYEHRNNFDPSTVTWEVLSGSITITSISADTAEATLKFGDDFNGGRILATSEGAVICSEWIDIAKN